MGNIKKIYNNLVGMYAFFVEKDKIKARIQICGMANEHNFICQIISPLTGDGNIAKLMTLDELREWVIIPTQELASEILEDYYNNNNVFRYGINFKND